MGDYFSLTVGCAETREDMSHRAAPGIHAAMLSSKLLTTAKLPRTLTSVHPQTLMIQIILQDSSPHKMSNNNNIHNISWQYHIYYLNNYCLSFLLIFCLSYNIIYILQFFGFLIILADLMFIDATFLNKT